MFEPQHFVDLQDNSAFGDSKSSWLTGDGNSSPTQRGAAQPSLGNSGATNSNVDRDLYKDLVEIVPLVQSLIDRKASSSFTRRGSMIYTKTPSRESLLKKTTDPKGRNAAQSLPPKRKKDNGDKDLGKNANSNQDADSFSIFSSRALVSEKEIEELVALREQVEDLQRKMFEKDELLKSLESSKSQVNAVHLKLDELKRLAAEKDSLIKSTQLQLSDAKIKLADKQAALEKSQWEAMTVSRKAEKLQEEVESMQGEMSSFMQIFEGLIKNDSTVNADDDYDIKPYYSDYLSDIDDLDDVEMQRMEEAREAYITAVAMAKEKQDEESMATAARARLHLQSFVFRNSRRES
ncbi:protein MICROTUBULE BINDING PROTEIN 2C [Citrus sinensis]|uniref:protein MICROTUBULE BINDING PROTEIN 2C n=1 Tax=Citrus sinensis TaxID=2711 RepID=UPI00219DE50E|nr:protein MICROTUBULE BINDING PROTEIN 2C [Citrus sinensis]KAH9722341.1 protein MICROTUBULE BINDING PROTEIN 2C [Citrus sinensis]